MHTHTQTPGDACVFLFTLTGRRLFKDNGLDGVELAWWDGAITFKETAGDSMTPTMDFQDCMDDIDQAPVSVEKAVAAYGDGSDDENDDEDEEGGGTRGGR